MEKEKTKSARGQPTEMNMYEQIRDLHNSGLYEDVKLLSSIAISLSEVHAEILTPGARYQVLVYQADAFFHDRQFKAAESIYKKALQLRREISKTKTKIVPADVRSDVDVKFQLHLCYVNLKQQREAITVLEGINAKQRTARVNLALARLYQRNGQDRSAITAYKEVLRECPFSIEAARGLLSLWVLAQDVEALMMASVSRSTSTSWVNAWVRAVGFTAAKDYPRAMVMCQHLDTKPGIRHNVEILLCRAETQHLSGQYSQALSTLNTVHHMEPLQVRKMDVYASLLYTERKINELEKLASELMQITDIAPEPWIAMGYYCLATRKTTNKAIYFAQKAYSFDSWNIEALLLKGTALLELNKIQDSIQHFREALKIDSARYEAHKGLVACHVTASRVRDAITCAGEAYRRLGQNARSLTLVASVMAKVPLSVEKAKSYLDKAMKLEPGSVDAVYCLADIFMQQQQIDKGIELLSKTLRQHSTSRLHQLLGDFLSHNNEHQEALDQYSIALSLDSNNALAREGLERVEKMGDAGLDQTYEAEEMNHTDNEVELEGSDIESAWSDIDLN